MNSAIASAAAQANPVFGRLVVEALRRLGVAHFVVSPGSRSTPLALAVAGLEPAASTVVLDERSAAFLALGRVKATRRPVALICTSGSAGAHYYPAVIEARESGLPLIVLTADRPPELRQCHAGQTIDQLKLFGGYPVHHAELPLPELDPALLRLTREACRRAVRAALGQPAGPVHVNCPFREPFWAAGGSGADTDLQPLLQGLQALAPVKATAGGPPELPERSLILAGPRPWADEPAEAAALIALARRRGFPILADGANPLRYGAPPEVAVITHYDRLARCTDRWAALAPEAVLLWGEPPTSKVLRQWLAESDVEGFLIGAGKPDINPFYGRISWLGNSAAEVLAGVPDGARGGFGAAWQAAEAEQEGALSAAMNAPHPIFEGDLHRALGVALDPGTPVIFAGSLAIRDADWFMPRLAHGLQPFSQRGANGIDGTVSLARGVAAGCGRGAVLVTGELAFLHDGNGLLNCADDPHGVFILVVNNAGGGIFDYLPVAESGAAFERFFAAPQRVDLRRRVEAHGAGYLRLDDVSWLAEALKQWGGRGTMVAEVRIDRAASRDTHRLLLAP
jgi:2-succinyl-5-enolpyruvyl-6-hydroxy-3-cyclohexene-1-carboxylate synthase